MADRPILFSAPMVRALLDGRKTQTRRGVSTKGHANPFDGRWTDSYVLDPGNAEWRQRHIRYAVGDHLWVREAWRVGPAYDDLPPRDLSGEECVMYLADNAEQKWGWKHPQTYGRYRHARFMPRWASRMALIVTDVRVQRLQDISEADARAEGCLEQVNAHCGPMINCYGPGCPTDPVRSCNLHGCWGVREDFQILWNSLHGPDAWDANPWVVALTFTVHRCNIDQMGKDNG